MSELVGLLSCASFPLINEGVELVCES